MRPMLHDISKWYGCVCSFHDDFRFQVQDVVDKTTNPQEAIVEVNGNQQLVDTTGVIHPLIVLQKSGCFRTNCAKGSWNKTSK